MSAKCPIGGIGRRSSTRTDAVALRPVGEPLVGKFRPPAEPARDRRETLLEQPARAAFRADVVDQDDLAAGPDHAREFVEGLLRMRHRRDDELRHHHVEAGIGQRQVGRIHHRQQFDIGELALLNALHRLAQHRLGNVAADQPVHGPIVGQRNAGADADFQDTPALRAAGLFGGGDGRPPPGIEHRAEHQVVNRRPARIGALHAVLIDVPHGPD